MQHAGLQYGQGAANSHQSSPFALTDLSQQGGGNTTSSLRQFRKKDNDKHQQHHQQPDLGTTSNIGENSQIARVPPHNHYPARPPNDYYRYHPQYSDFTPYKEPPSQVKYSEIAEATPTQAPPPSIQHVDISPIQKHKEKDFMDMCNITQQAHMKQGYPPDNLTRQQSYPDTSIHPQYLPKESQVHPNYKPPESQYQQYPHQLSKYNMPPSQCRKYPTPEKYPTPPENDFLAKLQRLHPTMARSIMSDHHIREAQAYPSSMEQNRMYPQNPPQRYYPPPPPTIQNNSYQYHSPHNMTQYNYPASCNYKHDYTGRTNQMANSRYPPINPTERSISPRRTYQENLINYQTVHQKISPTYPPQYNHSPEYAQHYQHRRPSITQEYYQQNCRPAPPHHPHHQYPISETSDNRSSSGLRHFLENWAEEEGGVDLASAPPPGPPPPPPIFKDNRLHETTSTEQHQQQQQQQVFVINSTDIPPQCLESISLVPTENGQYIIKSGTLENSSVVRLVDKETSETSNERTVNLQILDNIQQQKQDCMLETNAAPAATTSLPEDIEEVDDDEDDEDDVGDTSPQPEIEGTNQKPQDCQQHQEIVNCLKEDDKILHEEIPIMTTTTALPSTTDLTASEFEAILKEKPQEELEKKDNDCSLLEDPSEEELSKIEPKDMPILEDNNSEKLNNNAKHQIESATPDHNEEVEGIRQRIQRFFSVDDIMNNIGNSAAMTQLREESKRRSSLQFSSPTIQNNVEEKEVKQEEDIKTVANSPKPEEAATNSDHDNDNEENNEIQAISVDDNSVILELGGALVQLNINNFNGNKVLSVFPLSEPLIIDVNGNYEECWNQNRQKHEEDRDETVAESTTNKIQEEQQNEKEESPKIEDDVDQVVEDQSEERDEEDATKEKDEETIVNEEECKILEETTCQNEVIIGEEIEENEEITLNFVEDVKKKEEISAAEKILRRTSLELIEDGNEVLTCFPDKLVFEKMEIINDRRTKLQGQIDEEKEIQCDIKHSNENDEINIAEDSKEINNAKHNTIENVKIKHVANEENTNHMEANEEIKQTNHSKEICHDDEDINQLEDKIAYEEEINNETIESIIKETIDDTEKSDSDEISTIKSEDNDKKSSNEQIEEQSVSNQKKHDLKQKSADNQEKDELKTADVLKKEIKLLGRKKLTENSKKAKLKSSDDQRNKKLKAPDDTKKEKLKSIDGGKKENLQIQEDNKKIIGDKRENSKTDDNNSKKEKIRTEIKEKKLPKQKQKNDESIGKINVTTKPEACPVVTTTICTKAAKKLYNDQIISSKKSTKKDEEKPNNKKTEVKKSASKLEEAVNKIKLLKLEKSDSGNKDVKKDRKINKDEKRRKQECSPRKVEVTSSSDNFNIVNGELENVVVKPSKPVKRVSFNLENEDAIKSISSLSSPQSSSASQKIDKEVENNRKRLSWEEYSSRKRRCEQERRQNISEKTVTSSSSSSSILDDVSIEKVELSIENEINKDSITNRAKAVALSLSQASNQWEEEVESPQPSQSSDYEKEALVMSLNASSKNKVIIDVNEFNIKPIEPSPVSSSQFSEDDSLQVYKDVVDSKLSSLSIQIPKAKPKSIETQQLTSENSLVLIKRFLSKRLLNCTELEEVKKIIEYKRRIKEDEQKKQQQHVQRHLQESGVTIPPKRKRKRFRNLYDDSTSSSLNEDEIQEMAQTSNSPTQVGDYSVYQRNSQGVPKLIFKRNSAGLPQPFVKLERSQAAELLAKKRKFY